MDEKIKKRIRQLREQYGIPTPKKGVSLFRSGVDGPCIASVYPDNDIRALGFKEAADILVNIAVKEPGYANYLVYSVGYLYRMYIELRLKTIIKSAKRVSRTGHNLEELWKGAKPIMGSSSQFFNDQELEAVEEKIQEYFRIDPSSDAFRYSTSRKGEPTLEDIPTVDLRHLKGVIDSISTSLEGSYTAICEDCQSGRSL